MTTRPLDGTRTRQILNFEDEVRTRQGRLEDEDRSLPKLKLSVTFRLQNQPAQSNLKNALEILGWGRLVLENSDGDRTSYFRSSYGGLISIALNFWFFKLKEFYRSGVNGLWTGSVCFMTVESGSRRPCWTTGVHSFPIYIRQFISTNALIKNTISIGIGNVVGFASAGETFFGIVLFIKFTA